MFLTLPMIPWTPPPGTGWGHKGRGRQTVNALFEEALLLNKNLLAWRVKPNPKKHFKITHNSSRFLSVTPCLHTDSTQSNGFNCPFTERPKSRLFFSKATSHFNFFVDAICKTKTDVLVSHWRPLTAQKCPNSRNNEQLFHGTSHSPREMCGKARVDILSVLVLDGRIWITGKKNFSLKWY